jgi:S1-C subfamily serine protease
MKARILIFLCLVVTNIHAQKVVHFYYYVDYYTENEAKKYFNSNSIDPIEGIWQSTDGFKYSIEKQQIGGTSSLQIGGTSSLQIGGTSSQMNSVRLSNKYRVIILDNNSINSFWEKTYIKAYIEKTVIDNVFNIEYYVHNGFNNQLTIQSTIGTLEENSLLTFRVLKNYYNGYSEKISLIKLFPEYDNKSPNIKDIEKKQKITGTCFAISSDGYLVTNYHLVENSTEIKIKGVNGDFLKPLSAKVILSDKNNDLALLKIDDYFFTSIASIPYIIKSTPSNVGENIFVLGYPLTATMGEEIKLTNGIISSKSGFQRDITSYQMTAPIQPGNSGAPMFDKDGNIVGIVNAKHVGAENAGYAVKTSYFFNLIDALPTTIELPTVNTLKGKTLSSQVELANKFVYIIEVN